MAEPCDARDGTASQITFFDSEVGLLLCEQQVTGERLIARTPNAGLNFEALADSRPTTGLDGEADALELDAIGPQTAWILFTNEAECPEGQIRVSHSQGGVWQRLPCPSKSANVDLVLDVKFTSVNNGVMLGVSNGTTAMFTTDDGGSTWTPSP